MYQHYNFGVHLTDKGTYVHVHIPVSAEIRSTSVHVELIHIYDILHNLFQIFT